MKKIIFAIILFNLLACNNSAPKAELKSGDPNQKNSILMLSWLIGKWKSVNDKLITYEIWEKKNDQLYSGTSFTLKGEDTLFQESITLQQNGNEIYYIPLVKDQNEGKPVPFKFTKIKDGEYYFENPEHDFPQVIIYKNPQPDFLCARIEGISEGVFHKEDFNFVRIE